MDRRAYLTGIIATATVTAGCLGGGDGDDTDDGGTEGEDGTVILNEAVGGGAGGAGGGSGGDGIGGGGDGVGGGGLEGEPGDAATGTDSVLPSDATPLEYPLELQAGDRIEIRIENRGYKTGFRLYDPGGNGVLEGEVGDEKTFTHTVETSGEYSLLVAATDRANVAVTRYSSTTAD